MNSLNFCPDIDIKSSLFELVHQNVIDLSSINIERIYDYWKDEFYGKKPSLYREGVILSRRLLFNNINIPEEATTFGVDLPVWFNNLDFGKKIIILGIDPLRRSKTFVDMQADIHNHVILGTPYAVHMPAARTGRTKQYWQFINCLAKKNFVYLTDIYKVFFDHVQGKSYSYFQANNNDKSLCKEIDMIKPDIIITLGSMAYSELFKVPAPRLTRNIGLNIANYNGSTVLPMVHLSGRNPKKTFMLFCNENNVEIYENYIGEAYYQIVESYLNN